MTPQQILEGIRDADYHRAGIRCLRLLELEAGYLAALRADTERLLRQHAPSNVAAAGHPTGWTRPYGEVAQYSLLNASGDYADVSSDHDLSCRGKAFHDAARFPALARLIGAFPHCLNFRVNVLGPGAGLSPHEEHVTLRLRSGRVGLRARFHLPLQTNPGAAIVLDNYSFHLREGVVYLVNNGCVHAAGNAGDSARVHLVWDMLMTAEAVAAMFGEGELSGLPARRLRGAQREVRADGYRPLGPAERLSPSVSLAQAQRIGVCEVQ